MKIHITPSFIKIRIKTRTISYTEMMRKVVLWYIFLLTICILIKQLFKVIHVPAYVLYYISIICYFLIYSVKLTFKQFSRLQKSSINFHHKNSLSLSFYDIVIKCIFIFNRTDLHHFVYLSKEVLF